MVDQFVRLLSFLLIFQEEFFGNRFVFFCSSIFAFVTVFNSRGPGCVSVGKR